MDFVWVFPLLLVFLTIGQIHTKGTEKSSENCKECPAGYRKSGACSNGKYPCEKCESGTYTEIPNTLDRCLKCDPCSGDEVEIRSCSFNRSVECDCMDGYYYHGSGHSRYCTRCKDTKKNDLGSCENNTDCERKCTATRKTTTTTTPLPTTLLPTTPLPTTTTSTTITTTNDQTSSPHSPNPAVDPLLPKNDMLWLFYVLVVLLVVVMLFGLVLLLIWMHSGTPNTCTWWDTNKEQCSQDSSPTTLTINISEETPMMPFNYSPNTPQHPAHVPPLLPNSAQKVPKQDEQSEQWPAIVLYAIIKEVPLRRWKEFLRLLSVADQQLERVELEAGLGLGSIERQYQMLRLWSQRSSASLDDVFSALHYMDLSGCAQLLKESLEKL